MIVQIYYFVNAEGIIMLMKYFYGESFACKNVCKDVKISAVQGVISPFHRNILFVKELHTHYR